MRKFELISEHLQDYKNGLIEDLMYKIKGDTNLIKQIVCERIKEVTENFLFNTDEIKQLNVYVVGDYDSDGKTMIFFDFDENNDLCLISKGEDFGIDDIEAVKSVVINWLLGEEE